MTETVYSQLDLLADFAITLLGFIAVFLILSNKDGRFLESDRNFVQSIVTVASLAFVLGIIPRPLSLFVSESSVWEIVLFVGLIGIILICLMMVWFQAKMDPVEAAKVHLGWHIVAWGTGICAVVPFVVGVFGYFDASVLYLTAITFMLINCIWCFIAIVFRRFF